MSVEFHKEFGISNHLYPFKKQENNFRNSSEIDWAKFCELDKKHEIYIVGNPPYAGARNQSKSPKADMKKVFGEKIKHSNLDYISMWFYLSASLANLQCI